MYDPNFRSSQAESKIRIQKLDKTANRCNSRIHKSAKISLWIRYPSKIILRIRRPLAYSPPSSLERKLRGL